MPGLQGLAVLRSPFAALGHLLGFGPVPTQESPVGSVEPSGIRLATLPWVVRGLLVCGHVSLLEDTSCTSSSSVW